MIQNLPDRYDKGNYFSYVIVDDSSKSKLGGGQQVNLNLASILAKKNLPIFFVDADENRIYHDKLRLINKLVLCFYRASPTLSTFKTAGEKSLWRILGESCLSTRMILDLFLLLLHIKATNKNLHIICTTRKVAAICGIARLVLVISGHTFTSLKITRYFHSASEGFSGFLIDFIVMLLGIRHNIMVSNFIYKSLPRLITTKCVNHVVYNSVSCTNSHLVSLPNFNTNTIRIGFMGGDLPWKGFQIMLNYIRKKNIDNQQNVKFSIFGNVSEAGVQAINGLPNVFYAGFLSTIECQTRCDVVCVLSTSPESFSLVALETLFFGNLLVRTCSGALPETAPDDLPGVFSSPTNDSPSIEQTIDAAIEFFSKKRMSRTQLIEARSNHLNKFTLAHYELSLLNALV